MYAQALVQPWAEVEHDHVTKCYFFWIWILYQKDEHYQQVALSQINNQQKYYMIYTKSGVTGAIYDEKVLVGISNKILLLHADILCV
jgi:hypothetical protein